MSNLSLNTGLKALLSAQYVLDTVGHNLANANTRGYSRQRVHLEASLALPSRGNLVGSGVDIGRIERSVDELLSRRIGTQKGIFGGLGARYSGLSELETFFGASDESALSGLLDDYFTSISDLSTAPSDPILRTGLVQSSRTLTSRFHEVSGQLSLAKREIVGGRSWFSEGSRFFLGLQREDGAIPDPTCMSPKDVLGTATALLFLTRATKPISGG